MVKPRSPRPTVQCVDTYCELYKDLFIEVGDPTVNGQKTTLRV